MHVHCPACNEPVFYHPMDEGNVTTCVRCGNDFPLKLPGDLKRQYDKTINKRRRRFRRIRKINELILRVGKLCDVKIGGTASKPIPSTPAWLDKPRENCLQTPEGPQPTPEEEERAKSFHFVWAFLLLSSSCAATVFCAYEVLQDLRDRQNPIAYYTCCNSACDRPPTETIVGHYGFRGTGGLGTPERTVRFHVCGKCGFTKPDKIVSHHPADLWGSSTNHGRYLLWWMGVFVFGVVTVFIIGAMKVSNL